MRSFKRVVSTFKQIHQCENRRHPRAPQQEHERQQQLWELATCFARAATQRQSMAAIIRKPRGIVHCMRKQTVGTFTKKTHPSLDGDSHAHTQLPEWSCVVVPQRDSHYHICQTELFALSSRPGEHLAQARKSLGRKNHFQRRNEWNSTKIHHLLGGRRCCHTL